MTLEIILIKYTSLAVPQWVNLRNRRIRMGTHSDEPRAHKPAIIPTQKELEKAKKIEEEKARKREEARR